MIQVHRFDDTSDAYDAAQCDPSVSDGDILVIDSEMVVGVLVEAWPVAVTRQTGAFHRLKNGHSLTWMQTSRGGRSYEESRIAADREVIAQMQRVLQAQDEAAARGKRAREVLADA